LAAAGLDCGPGSGPWHGLEVCSWASSGKWPALEPEKPVLLEFGSRQALTAPLRQVREVYEIHLLPASEQSRVRENLSQIAALSMDKASRLLLAAGVYAQSGLYADAIATYDEALQSQEMPEARVTLGDLYLTAGLTAFADREYRQVLTGAPDSAARAAAELGLGYVSWFRKLFSDARAHFERSRELYARLGLPAEAEDARAAAARLQAPGGNGSP
jgi:tetratricopeptide (TPR) repeat protein